MRLITTFNEGIIVKEKIYDLSPVFVQNIFTTFYGYKLKRERYGTEYKNKKEELKSLYKQSKEKLQKVQLNKLITFIELSKENSVYYKKKLLKKEVSNLSDLKYISILNKEELRANIEDIKNDENGMIAANTGGTTGKSLTVFYTNKDFQHRMAYLDFFRESHGAYHGMRRASFGGRILIPKKDERKVKFWRNNYALKQRLYSTYHTSEKNIPYYINDLNKYQPEYIDGFPSPIVDIAKYIKRNNIKLTFKPVAIFPTSEPLTDEYRQILEEVFQTNVYDQYASSEGAPFITECKNKNLHLHIDSGVFELYSDNNPTEILVTSFTTHGTPLIRYKIGDSLMFTDRECDCGLPLPIVDKIIGREQDYLYTEERGKVYSHTLVNALKSLDNLIVKGQFLQYKKNEVIVKIVTSDQNIGKKIEAKLTNEVQKRLGYEVKIIIDRVDEIEREKSGKYRLIKNYLN